MALNLTTRDRHLLTALTRRVKVLTQLQVDRTWCSDANSSQQTSLKRLRRLESEGLVQCVTMMAHPEIPLAEPVLAWTPGNELPDFRAVAFQLRSRWNMPLVPTRLILATRLANHRFGGYIGSQLPQRTEVTHDIHLAQVFLWYLHHRPAYAKRWVSEHELYARGGGRNERLPDALIEDRDRERQRDLIVEFGGAYTKTKLLDFHDALRGQRYEIW
jgi:hypothetical protein